MKYSIIVICETQGCIEADTDEIQNLFFDKFIKQYSSELEATNAVLEAVKASELKFNDEEFTGKSDAFVVNPYDHDVIANQFVAANEYAFRDWSFGQPDGIWITIGVGLE